MDIGKKVQTDYEHIAYPAKECMYSGRKKLNVGSKDYCMLNDYCPLQELKDKYLPECTINKYLLWNIKREKSHAK